MMDEPKCAVDIQTDFVLFDLSGLIGLVAWPAGWPFLEAFFSPSLSIGLKQMEELLLRYS